MAGFISRGNNEYIGTYTLKTGEATIYNGMFVQIVSHSAQTCATPNINTQYVYFVENVIDTVAEQMINDLDYPIVAGKYVRIKKLIAGEEFVTDKVTGTPAVDAVCDCSTTGLLTATSGSPNQTFVVIEKPTMWNKTVYRCLVLK